MPDDQQAQDDEALLRRCRRGNEHALRELIGRYEHRIYHVALRAVGDPALAEEATVDTFYKIWRRAAQFSGDAPPAAWILRIAARTCLDLNRGRQRWWRRNRAVSTAIEQDSEPGPENRVWAEEERSQRTEKLNRAIRRLKDDDRLLVHLYYFEGQSLAEIAVTFRVSRDAMKMRLARARRQLRVLLEESDLGFGSEFASARTRSR